MLSMNESYRAYEKLLKAVVKISDHYEEIYRTTSENFNIFQVLDVEEKEKFICKFYGNYYNLQAYIIMESFFSDRS